MLSLPCMARLSTEVNFFKKGIPITECKCPFLLNKVSPRAILKTQPFSALNNDTT